jgi:hypothetical protein
MVGLMALFLDAFLDPIISVSFTCTPTTLNHVGMGYWQWYAEADLANAWYGIPAFNYAAWYAAPVLLVTLVMLARWIWQVIQYFIAQYSGIPTPVPSFMTGLFQLVVAIAFFVIVVSAPDADPADEQLQAIRTAMVLSFLIVLAYRSTYDRNNAFRWEFVVPQLFFFSLPLLMLLFSGNFDFSQDSQLLVLSVFLVIAGFYFALSPYSGSWVTPFIAPNTPAAGGASPRP